MAKKKGPKAGRAKQKQKSARPGNADTARGFTVDSDDDYDVPPTMFRGFDGSTTRHHATIDPLLKLRHRAITFVSAGTNPPVESDVLLEVSERSACVAEAAADSEEEESPQGMAASPEMTTMADNLKAHCTISTMDISTMDISTMDGSMDNMAHTQQPSSSSKAADGIATTFMIDLEGDTSLSTKQHAPPRAASPTLSASSGEIVIFRGRNKATIIDDPVPAPAVQPRHLPPHLRPRSVLSTTSNTSLPPHHVSTGSNAFQRGHVWPSKPAAPLPPSAYDWTPAPPGVWWRKSKDEPESAPNTAELTPEIQAAAKQGAEATIAILHSAWQQSKRAEEREITARVARGEPAPVRTRKKLSRRDKRARNRQVVSDAETSDPDEAAYRDYLDNVNQQSQDDASEDMEVEQQLQIVESAVVDSLNATEWQDTEGSDSEEEIIGQDLDEVYTSEQLDVADDFDSSDLEAEIAGKEEDMLRDMAQQREQRLRTLTDEQMARLWQKQAELGIDADELIIDDGEIGYRNSDGDFGDVDAARAGFSDFIALQPSKKKTTRRGPAPAFANASALADAVDQYGNEGFDIMDMDRPSLRPGKKGRKGKMPPALEALSDEELRNGLFGAWDNDREKKRAKKVEREELRKQGLLGTGKTGKTGKPDLSQKYRQGMTIAEAAEELERFLRNDDHTTLTLPPMDKTDRQALHMVASKLNLKSKSVGNGNNRAPSLYKTKASRRYTEADIDRALRALSRGFFRNQSFHGQVAKKGAPRVQRSGAGQHLRHGELVGAGAEEIGKDNFGSRLMEKMGWTRGTALGKDGEGMLHPVEQVMRIGKAGLG